jgi:psp operon transcriptional activator
MPQVFKKNMSASPEALGQSEAFLEFQERLSRVAPVNRPVVLLGERGTGKELAAARLHYLSGRWEKPFVALNCSALAASLIESELFGYERGAFTGAAQRRAGRFESADGGTLFLDEIGNVPVEVQEKVLRTVEYGTFERVGGSETLEVDVRIVAATNTDLRDLVKHNRFKADLLDRLSFEVLVLPPLRTRAGDIPMLARHFAARMATELGIEEAPEFSPESMAAMERYAWPGNVRELKNVVERAVYRSAAGRITDVVFDPFADSAAREGGEPAPGEAGGVRDREAPGGLAGLPLKEALRELKLSMLAAALERSRYNQRKAAALLGLTYDQFRGLYRQYKALHPSGG